MKTTLRLLAILPWLLLAACRDRQEAPTGVPNEISVHEPGWNIPSSTSFHGKFLASAQYDSRECRQCHGNPESTDNKSLVGISCRDCHESFPHRQGWNDLASASFHGKILAAAQYVTTSCVSCHGSDYNGGTSNVSCKTCHASYPHPTGWVTGATSHIPFIKTNGYDLNSCKSCHGQNYAETKVNNSCLTCHTKQGGPEACTTCHGDANGDVANLLAAAPPRGLDGETSTTSPAVGSHQAHFAYFNNLPASQVCQECHTVPANYSAASHIDADARAEAPLAGALAAMRTEGGNRIPDGLYDSNANTCGNTYCHGNWGLVKSQSTADFAYVADKIQGNNASPKWTDPSSAACGTCHGLPPTGHQPFDMDVCYICHGDVMDFNGTIIDKTKHVNGKVNLLGMEYPMF